MFAAWGLLSLEDRSRVGCGRGMCDVDVELRLGREEMLVLGSIALLKGGCAEEMVARRRKRQRAHVLIWILGMLAFMVAVRALFGNCVVLLRGCRGYGLEVPDLELHD